MYIEHYGFRDKPFKLTHDPEYYYDEIHQVPMNELCYSVEERQGLAVLLGEAGTGKTTLLLRLLDSFTRQLHGVFLSDVAVGESSLIRQVSRALVIPFKPQDSTDVVSQYLDIYLRGQVTAGRTVVVLIDEAQGLTDGQFEEVRYLTNLEHKGRKLIEIVLAGLPSLERKFRTPEMESLNQRAVVHCWVEPLSLESAKSYIRHRLEVVEAPNPGMFDDDALERVHRASRGIPRLINIVCERTMLVGYVEETQRIRASHVDQAVADLNLKPTGDGTEQQTGHLGFEGSLLMKMAAQLDSIVKRLEDLELPAAEARSRSNGATPVSTDVQPGTEWESVEVHPDETVPDLKWVASDDGSRDSAKDATENSFSEGEEEIERIPELTFMSAEKSDVRPWFRRFGLGARSAAGSELDDLVDSPALPISFRSSESTKSTTNH